MTIEQDNLSADDLAQEIRRASAGGEAAAQDRAMRGGMDCNYPDCGCCHDSKCSDAPAPSPAPVVRELEWTTWGRDRHTAKSMGVSYSIRSGGASADGAFDLEIDSYTAKKGGFPTLPEAKAVAQADFAARILSALHSKALPDVSEALLWTMDEIDILSNKLCNYAYPQGMMFLRRSDQAEAYVKAVEARAALNAAQGGK